VAQIYGALRSEATFGERRLLEVAQTLPNDYLVYPELPVIGAGETFCDCVIFSPGLGIVVLEVKDWICIEHATPDSCEIRTRDGKLRGETHPLRGVRDKAYAIVNRLKTKPRLIHQDGPHQGKLVLPWTYCVVFPNLRPLDMLPYEGVIAADHVILHDELQTRPFVERLRTLPWKFSPNLTDDAIAEVHAGMRPEITRAMIDDARGAIDPVLVVSTSPQNQDAVLDTTQEDAAKDGLRETQSLADELPQSGKQLAANLKVRLVRGVSGSGKTLVLMARARYLAHDHPDWKILLLTFNEPLATRLGRQLADISNTVRVAYFHQVCRKWLEDSGCWQDPVKDTLGRITHVRDTRFPSWSDLRPDFLEDEFEWMKDTGCITLEQYLAEPRDGRGVALPADERRRVFAVFEAYQKHLALQRKIDYGDVPLMALQMIEAGEIQPELYDAILIDEAQDFAPAWFAVLRRILNPETGVMFMAADATQRIYRKFTWKSLGLNVVGRTKILPRSYRTTFEIMQSAHLLVGDSEALVQQLEKEQELVAPELDPNQMRRGPFPVLTEFADVKAEREFLIEWVRDLLSRGYQHSDIAILHRRSWGPEKYLTALKAANLRAIHLRQDVGDTAQDAVVVSTMHLAKGLEYRAIYIGQLQELYRSDKLLTPAEYRSFIANETALLYVAMTRARDALRMSHQSGKLPRELTRLAEFLEQQQRVGTAQQNGSFVTQMR
jgi:hypothetical protein